jgi:hypothetical protein
MLNPDPHVGLCGRVKSFFPFRPPFPLQEIKSRSSIFVLIAIGTAIATTRRKTTTTTTTSGNIDVNTQTFHYAQKRQISNCTDISGS